MEIEYINPGNMVKPRGYSHAVSVSGGHKTIYVGGQNAVDEEGNLVGRSNLREQVGQVLTNIEKVLGESNAKFGDVIKFNVYLLQGQNPAEGFQAFQQKWGKAENFPVVTVLFVAGLGNPEWLVEIEAIGVIPE